MPPDVKLFFQPQPEPDKLLKNLSAVVFSAGTLWTAGDEANDGHNTIERLTWDPQAGAFGDHVRFRVDDFLALPAGPGEEIDIEGLALGDGYLWLIGSHSWAIRKPKKAKGDASPDDRNNIDRLRFKANRADPNRYLIARIPVENNQLVRKAGRRTAALLELTASGNRLTEELRQDAHIGPYLLAQIPSKANGFDVEGLEYLNGRLFIGLRGPVLLDYSFVIEVEPKDADEKGVLGLRKIGPKGARYRKHFIHLHGRGVRDLCRHGEDLLLLSGPTMGLDAPAAVYRLKSVGRLEDDRLHEPAFVRTIPFREEGQEVPRGTDHAEGLTVVRLDGGPGRVLVLYDSPNKARLPRTRDEPPFVVADLFDLPA